MKLIIFTYNRLNELKMNIEYLLKNKGSEKLDVIFFSDAPKKEADVPKVNEVRKYLKSVKGFNSIEIIEREKNYGLSKNIVEGVTEIINVYNRVIVLEDDLITSSNFLCYMKEALDFYDDKEKIFSVSGYSMPLKALKRYNYDTYLSYRPSSWGWATWKDRWNTVDWEIKDFDEFIKDKKLQKDFNKGGADLTRMLKHYFLGKNNSWAIRWSYNMWKQNKFSVYPKVSKIQNIGFGEDATHCKGVNIYKTVLDTSGKCDFNFVNQDYIDENIIKDFRFQYSYINKAIKKALGYLK